MTSFQKTIKYAAIAFAIFLSISIIGGILSAASSVFHIFSNNKNTVSTVQNYTVNRDISNIDIEVSAAELIIKIGTEFRIDSNYENLKIKENENQLSVTEKDGSKAVNRKNMRIEIYVPNATVFNEAKISTGAGRVNIESLSADRLYIDLGAGEAKIQNLTANNSAKINGGAGSLSIESAKLNNLELDMGMGELEIEGKILGKSSIDYGMGSTEIKLYGSLNDYQISLDKGIGEATLNDRNMRDDSVYGSGVNEIEIDGGIGELEIELIESYAEMNTL